jgi:hypothetical protein
LSLKERLAAKKAEKETPKKTEKKVDKKATSKGRPAGMKYVVKEKVAKDLNTRLAKFIELYEFFTESIESFIEKGNKSQAKKAREHLQSIAKQIKDFRKAIQDAKIDGLSQEPK